MILDTMHEDVKRLYEQGLIQDGYVPELVQLRVDEDLTILKYYFEYHHPSNPKILRFVKTEYGFEPEGTEERIRNKLYRYDNDGNWIDTYSVIWRGNTRDRIERSNGVLYYSRRLHGLPERVEELRAQNELNLARSLGWAQKGDKYYLYYRLKAQDFK